MLSILVFKLKYSLNLLFCGQLEMYWISADIREQYCKYGIYRLILDTLFYTLISSIFKYQNQSICHNVYYNVIMPRFI